jgi:hypothetical protein
MGKYTNMSAFEEKCELLSMIFPSVGTKYDVKTGVKAILPLVAQVPL